MLFAGYFPNPVRACAFLRLPPCCARKVVPRVLSSGKGFLQLLFGYDKHTQWLSVRTACVIEAMGE